MKSQNIYLGPLLQEDLPILFKWINDNELVKFNANYKPITEQEHHSWFERISHSHETIIFGIRLCSSQEIIGTCQLTNINFIHRNAELRIRMGSSEFRGKSYGTEAVNLLLRFAFDDLNLQRVHLHVFCNNNVAVKLYEKVGFIKEGTMRKAAYIDGHYLDVAIMGILREEYHDR